MPALIAPLPAPVVMAHLAVEPSPVKKRKPRVWPAFTALVASIVTAELIGLVVFLGGVVVGAEILRAMGHAASSEEGLLMAQKLLTNGTLLGAILALLCFQLTMGGITLLAAKLSPIPARLRLGFVKPVLPRKGWLAIALAPLALLTLAKAIWIAMYMMTPVDPTSSALHVESPSLAAMLTMTLLTSLLPAFFEEMMFRGFMQRRLLQRWSPAVAIGVTSVLFALIHTDSLHHILAVLPVGILFGLVAYRSGSIWPTIVLHFLYNAYIGLFGIAVTGLIPHLSESGLGVFVIGCLALFFLAGLPAVAYLAFGRTVGTPSHLNDVEREVAAEAATDYDFVLDDAAAAVPEFRQVPHRQPLASAAEAGLARDHANDPLTTLSA